MCNINNFITCDNPINTNIDLYYTSIELNKDIKILNNNIYENAPNGIYKIEGFLVEILNGKIVKIENCNLEETNISFGDTFIGEFTLKRKHSFFKRNTFQLPNGTDFDYSIVPNIAYPIYFFDTVAKPYNITTSWISSTIFPLINPTISMINDLQGIWKDTFLNVSLLRPPFYKFDCFDNVHDINSTANNKKFIMNPLTGVVYTYIYGIPKFIVESEINLDFREQGETYKERFYPKESDLQNWLQEKNVPIVTDNYYIYDLSFSKQPTESFYYLNSPDFKGQQDCKTIHSQRVIYTAQSSNIDDSNQSDSFLINRALDFEDFELKGGKLISIDQIEGNKVFVRQENISSVFNAYIEINTNQDTALISAGSIFKNKPIQYSNTTIGYFGSQHKAILNTPFGHVTVDAKRGNVFLLANGGQGLDEISNQGLKHWFKENLPFTIDKQFNNVNIDNAFNGIGLIMVYDNRFNTFYITKLDYECINKEVKYNEISNTFYLENPLTFISLQNKKYFKNKSWTISYNFYTKSWVSWHSFTPNYYIEHIDSFDSGTQKSLWKHNLTNKSYQKYYGKLYPFIVESIEKGQLQNRIVNSVSYYVDVYNYLNKTDYLKIQDKSFNKAIVYNQEQNTGLLELEQVKNNLFLKSILPISKLDRTIIELKIKENIHSFNQFKNKVKQNIKEAIWYNLPNNAQKELNISAFDYKSLKVDMNYLKGTNFRIRLINDKESRYKFIYKGNLIENGTGVR